MAEATADNEYQPGEQVMFRGEIATVDCRAGCGDYVLLCADGVHRSANPLAISRPDAFAHLGELPNGMARRSDGAVWNPRPAADYAISSRKAYHAGYSDGFHGASFGAGDEDAHGAFSTYRSGFADGRADAQQKPLDPLDEYRQSVDASQSGSSL